MNIHAIIVHFPIALLVLYSFFEVISWGRLGASRSWFFLKTVFLLLGVVFALLARVTGGFAADAYGETRLVELHEGFAGLSIALYIILAVIYLVQFSRVYRWSVAGNVSALVYKINVLDRLWRLIQRLSYRLYAMRWMLVLLAVAGFTALGITGALGGAISHGPEADFVTSFIYNLFF